MNEFAAIAKVCWYDESSAETIEDYLVVTNVKDFSSTVAEIEKYYGNDLESVEVSLVEGPFLMISKKYHDAIKNNNHLTF